MAAGHQAFDGQGRLVMDLSDRLSRTAGSFFIGSLGPFQSASAGLPALSTGTPWFTFIPFNNGGQLFSPIFTLSSSTLSYRTTNYTSPGGLVVYGVF